MHTHTPIFPDPFNCSWYLNISDHPQNNIVAVLCTNLNVRLTSSNITEVCMNESWKAIHPSNNATATFLCRQLGFSIYGKPIKCFTQTVHLFSYCAGAGTVQSNIRREAVRLNCSSGVENHFTECAMLSPPAIQQVLAVNCRPKCKDDYLSYTS